MPKTYAKSAASCTKNDGGFHVLVYQGKTMLNGRLQRSLEYRCDLCGEFITKPDLQEATNA